MAAFLFDTHDGFQYTVTFEPVNAYQIFIGLQQHFIPEFYLGEAPNLDINH